MPDSDLPSQPPPAPGASVAGLERLSAYSVVAAVCALIPVPWLDDLAERAVRRRVVGDLVRERGVEPTPADVAVLAGLERPRRGCVDWLLWPLTGVLLYLAKKLFRKIFFLLAVGDAVRAASEVFHDAHLLAHALGGGWLAPGAGRRIDRDEARWVRWAIESTTRETDSGPLRGAIRRALAGSGRLLVAEAVRLGGLLAGSRRGGAAAEERAAEEISIEGEAARLSGVSGRLTAALGLEDAYRREIEERLDGHLARAAEARRQAAAGAGTESGMDAHSDGDSDAG